MTNENMQTIKSDHLTIERMLEELKPFNEKLRPCPILTSKPLTEVEQKLGFRLPTQYVELMQHAGGATCGRIYLWNLRESLGNMRVKLGEISIAYGPVYVAHLLAKQRILMIGSNDNGEYYFIKGLRKNARDRSNSKVFAFYLDVYDEYEVEDSKYIMEKSYQIADSLYEFVMKMVADFYEFYKDDDD
ncbi:MAG: hypothetical protein EOL87_13840 [Spartobacteria bacterium]|nr:hypothetical protein [Spartobacteria bacterium]